jgi:hypothetical protein
MRAADGRRRLVAFVSSAPNGQLHLGRFDGDVNAHQLQRLIGINADVHGR